MVIFLMRPERRAAPMTEFLALVTTKESVTFLTTALSSLKLALGLKGLKKSHGLLYAWTTEVVTGLV
jgi:hypothetical protein